MLSRLRRHEYLLVNLDAFVLPYEEQSHKFIPSTTTPSLTPQAATITFGCSVSDPTCTETFFLLPDEQPPKSIFQFIKERVER